MTFHNNFRTFAEAKAAFAQDVSEHEARGVIIPGAVSYLTEGMKRDYGLAMDALPALNTAPNAGVPSMLTTYVDPTVYEVVFSPQKAVEVAGERKIGDWTMQTAMFPTIEHTVEVSSYGDFNTNGHAGANTNFPQRQAYLFQTIKEYGDLELERAGLARINWASELDRAAASGLNRFQNLTYFFGVAGIANYGLLNDPSLPAALTPGVKGNGNGNVWIFNNSPNATANEIFADIQALVIKLIGQSGGLVDAESRMTLGMSPIANGALATTNSFGISVEDLIKKNYPNMRIVTAVQYGALSATNPQGVAAGNYLQLIADEVEGQETSYCAFNEKLRAHPLFRDLSSYKQKVTAGTWGAIIRQPFAVASMVGI
jgi:hypothetical protein